MGTGRMAGEPEKRQSKVPKRREDDTTWAEAQQVIHDLHKGRVGAQRPLEGLAELIIRGFGRRSSSKKQKPDTLE